MLYDPAIHHRRSIRMRGHDYTRGWYFVTICAHWKAGRIFDPPAVREMVGRVWESVAGGGAGRAGGAPSLGTGGTHEGCPYVIMPDHFHGLIEMQGDRVLGEAIGEFKSRVVHAYCAGVRRGAFARFPGKLWHRNYYERIIRGADDWRRTEEYIRLNPMRLVFESPVRGVRGMGNPVLFEEHKTGLLCSMHAPPEEAEKARRLFRAWADGAIEGAVISGFHAPLEREALEIILAGKGRVIVLPLQPLEKFPLRPEWRGPLAEGRMLFLSPWREAEWTRLAALERNRLVAELADELVCPWVRPGGAVARLMEGAHGGAGEEGAHEGRPYRIR